jgi:chemotaxis signal transduction protein
VETGSRRYLTFRISGKEFAIDSSFVRGIVPFCELRPAPSNGQGDTLAGFARIGGHMFPVIDLRLWLGVSRRPEGIHARIIVIRFRGTEDVHSDEAFSGFLVDGVSDVLEYRARDVRNGRLYGKGRTRRLILPESLVLAPEVYASRLRMI